MKKYRRYLFILISIALSYAIYSYYPMLNILTGYAAKNMTSGLYLANRTQSSMEEGDNGFFPVNLAGYDIDEKGKAVKASIFGLMERKAIYVEGLGAILVNDSFVEGQEFDVPNRFSSNSTMAFPYGDLEQKDTVFAEVDYTKLKAAVDKAFDEKGEEVKQTRSVLVVYKDHILAEKYLNGFDKTSLMHGWSMTKSIMATMYGILQYQGLINIDETTGLESWKHDERKEISYSDLLHMNSGLAWDEAYFNISDVTKMLYLESDMGLSQEGNALIGVPNHTWNYSSGTTNLLGGPLLRSRFESHQAYLDFWYEELIDKIGMHSMVIEADLAGNYVGSSYAWATTRDWAKFGLLYLHQGHWKDQQIFDSSWANYVATPTNDSEGRYGAHFWLNAGAHYPDAPKDLYSCEGFKGQYVFIIPSKQLVVVRTGLKADPKFDVNAFLRDIVTSIH